jgi:hypothetical protein
MLDSSQLSAFELSKANLKLPPVCGQQWSPLLWSGERKKAVMNGPECSNEAQSPWR